MMWKPWKPRDLLMDQAITAVTPWFYLIPIGSMYAIYGNIYHQYTPDVSIYTIHGSYGICIWANYNDLTVLPNPGIMVNKRNHPNMAALFRLVNYYNLPRCMESINGGYPQMDGL